MGRLIDQDTLMQDIRNTITEQSSTIDWLNLIKRQPTAYDVDVVVKQLQKNADKNRGFYKANLNDNAQGQMIAYLHAIEIVKGGGVNGN